jgi:hypothetical protein
VPAPSRSPRLPPPARAPRAALRAVLVPRSRIPLLAALAALCALTLGACANTLQDQTVAPSFLEPLVLQDEFPVYWLGGSFQGLAIISVARDPTGAYTIKYGDCRQGGENVCITPLEIVTSPDNSFRPGGATPRRAISVRGVTGTLAQEGRTITLATGPVVVDLYADSAARARGAAAAMVTINAVQRPGAPLARPLPNTGFAQKPLPTQQPPAVPLAQTLPSARGLG